MAPRVSVLMAVYNGETSLRQSIDSILKQDYSDFEFIIIDDGSSDATAEMLASYDDKRMRVRRNETNIGLTKSLNRGLALARGEFVARQDADDVSSPERLARQVAWMEEHPETGLAGSNVWVLEGNHATPKLEVRPTEDAAIRWWMLFSNVFAHSSVMFRRSLLATVQGYDESFPVSQDYELWSRMLRVTGVANIDYPLVSLRRGRHNISQKHLGAQNEWAERVSAREIDALLKEKPISLNDVRKLRDWWVWRFPQSGKLPRTFSRDDYSTVEVLARVVKAHACRGAMTVPPISAFRRAWAARLSSRLRPSALACRTGTSAVWQVIRLCPVTSLWHWLRPQARAVPGMRMVTM